MSDLGGGCDYNEEVIYLALRHCRRIRFEHARLCYASQRGKLKFNN
jgi:hypothetical protein